MRACKYLLIGILMATASCSSPKASQELQRALRDYGQIMAQYNNLLEKNMREQSQTADRHRLLDLKTRFRELQAEKKKKLVQLLKASGNLTLSPGVGEWLKFRLLLASDQPAEALFWYDALIKSAPHLTAKARWEKVKILNRLNRIHEAIPLFRQIEPLLPKDADLYATHLFFALNAADPALRREYAGKFLGAEKLPECLQPYRSRISLQMSRAALGSGDAKTARHLLETALAREHHPYWQMRMKEEIKHLDLIHKPAPPLSTENWLNPAALRGMRRRGTPQAILFWASWGDANRQELVFLKELTARFGTKGLMVMACTKLYGIAVDSQKGAIPISLAEESRQLQSLLSRLGISYPVLVSTEGKDFAAFQVTMVPTLVLVDREGLIADILTPTSDHEEIIKVISHLLGAQ